MTWQATIHSGTTTYTSTSYRDTLGIIRGLLGESGVSYISYKVGDAVSPVFEMRNADLYLTGLGVTEAACQSCQLDLNYGGKDCALDVQALVTSTHIAADWVQPGNEDRRNCLYEVDIRPICFWLAEAARFNPIGALCRKNLRGKISIGGFNAFRPLLNNWKKISSGFVYGSGGGLRVPISRREVRANYPALIPNCLYEIQDDYPSSSDGEI